MSYPAILYDNLFDYGTPAATTTETNYDVANITDWRPYTLWKGTGTSTQYITIDCATAKAGNTLAILGHNLYTQNATISVECSSDNFATDTTVALAGFIPSANTVIYKEFTAQTKRYWRLKIASYTAAPYIGVLVIGARMTFPDYIEDTGNFDPTRRGIVSASERSQNGNLLGTAVNFKKRTLNPSWKYLTNSWVENTLIPFLENHGEDMIPFFFIWDYGNHPSHVFLVKLPDDWERNFPYESGYRNVNLDLEGVVE